MQRTLILLKPDCVQRRLIGTIIGRFEQKGLRLAAMKLVKADQTLAAKHYEVHKERPFYNDLCTFMTSGPVVVQVLEGEDAVKRNRDVMGATNPADAANGTIRKVYAESIEANSVHGSDSDENAKIEIDFFFKPEEIVG